jgi:hypothetical protein
MMHILEHRTGYDWLLARVALQAEIGTTSIADWNDNPRRTQAEVLAAFRAAANS